jgi:hypothetical protein
LTCIKRDGRARIYIRKRSPPVCAAPYRYQSRLFSKKWLESKELLKEIPEHLQITGLCFDAARLRKHDILLEVFGDLLEELL